MSDDDYKLDLHGQWAFTLCTVTLIVFFALVVKHCYPSAIECREMCAPGEVAMYRIGICDCTPAEPTPAPPVFPSIR